MRPGLLFGQDGGEFFGMEGVIAAVTIHQTAHILTHLQRGTPEFLHISVLFFAGVQPLAQTAVSVVPVAIQLLKEIWIGRVKNTFHPPNISFDPNQEIGGALLELLRNNAANDLYKK